MSFNISGENSQIQQQNSHHTQYINHTRRTSNTSCSQVLEYELQKQNSLEPQQQAPKIVENHVENNIDRDMHKLAFQGHAHEIRPQKQVKTYDSVIDENSDHVAAADTEQKSEDPSSLHHNMKLDDSETPTNTNSNTYELIAKNQLGSEKSNNSEFNNDPEEQNISKKTIKDTHPTKPIKPEDDDSISRIPNSRYNIRSSDMNGILIEWVFDCCEQVFHTGETLDTVIARNIKQRLDEKFGPAWQVIVGKNYGSSTSHQLGTFLYFYINNYAILIWKTFTKKNES